jgi:hypothetical protein
VGNVRTAFRTPVRLWAELDVLTQGFGLLGPYFCGWHSIIMDSINKRTVIALREKGDTKFVYKI